MKPTTIKLRLTQAIWINGRLRPAKSVVRLKEGTARQLISIGKAKQEK